MGYRQYLENYVDVGSHCIREGTKRTTRWRIGCARNMHMNNNGYVKAVNLETERGTITRRIGSLVILPTKN